MPNHPFTVALKELMGIPADEAVWPTTGTVAAYVFSELFPLATLRFTGTTVAERPEQTEFAHGWGSAVAVTPEHRLAAEGALLRRWAAQGRIELVA